MTPITTLGTPGDYEEVAVLGSFWGSGVLSGWGLESSPFRLEGAVVLILTVPVI